MTTIITGGMNTDREERLISHIRAAVREGREVLVIIPDQFSFEFDKQLYKALGPVSFNRITTAGIDRLSETICEECGGSPRDKAEDNAQLILMFKAVRRFAKEDTVRFFRRSLGKAKFIGELITLTGQLRESGVTPEGLRLAAEQLEGSVSLKLFDLAAIYKYYLEEIDKAGMSDLFSRAAEAAELVKDNAWFGDKAVFVSSFYDFTCDQLKILESAIRDGIGFCISLLIDEARPGSTAGSPFAVTLRTKQQIADLCAAHNKPPVLEKAVPAGEVSGEIRYLGERLFDFERKKITEPVKDVRILSADDAYEEADFICAEICRLVREEEYSYNDVAVALRESPGFAFILESAFEKYEIPYFIDRRDSVDASAIVHYINALFNTVLTRKFRTENIMRLMRSQLMGLINYEVSDLEDYCVRWGVDGDMWLTDFTAKPAPGASLERINKLRASIIDPLVEFRETCRDNTAAGISKAFYRLLERIQLSQQTYSLVRRASASKNETALELSRGLKQLWSLSLAAVGSIYDILGDEKISLRKYYELYSMILSRQKISSPPQKLECVRVFDPGRSRIDRVRAVFAAEVCEGVFPRNASSAGLVTEHEKELLRAGTDIVIEAGAAKDLRTERLGAYTALCAPTDKLYAIYSRSDLLGNERRPSVLIKELKEILGLEETLVSSLPVEFFCAGERSAYAQYIEHSRDGTPEVRSIYESLMDTEYYHKLRRIKAIDTESPYTLGKDSARELFFRHETVYASSTKLDNFYKCPFMYFCSYGLKLNKSQPVEMNAMNKGLLVHSVLERAAVRPGQEPKENRESFLAMTDEEITALIDSCFREYYDQEFSGGFGRTGVFEYQFSKLREQTLFIVKYVREELARGSFAPAVAEYRIDRSDEGDKLDLRLKDGRRIVLIGTIDRADIYENEAGEKFLRIVDYKYRKTVRFSLADLYCGLELQMLVYLSMLLETENEVDPDHDLKQAGVFYLKLLDDKPNYREDCELSEEELYEAACQSAVAALTRDGCITGNEGVNEVLDNSLDEKKLDKLTFSDSTLTALRIYAKRKVIEYGDRLLEGDIDSKPLEGVCSYCLYQGICGRAFPEEPGVGDEELMLKKLDEIKEEMDNGNGEGEDE